MFHKILAAIGFAALLISSNLCANPCQIVFQPNVIERAVQIQNRGILKQKDNGYLYLEVSNDFIEQLLPMINAPIQPTPDYSNPMGIGAHISVVYDEEWLGDPIFDINELGQEFTFTVKDLGTVISLKNNIIKKWWIINVDAPQLQQLRMNYGLSSKPKGYEYHVSIGIEILEESDEDQDAA